MERPPMTGGGGTRLSAEELLRRKAAIEEAHGPWTAHNVQLADTVFTIAPGPDWAHQRGIWAGMVAEVLLRRPLAELRVLDLGALEGGISLALGARGASVVGVEIREANLAKARFARDVLGLANVEFVEGDMLALDALELGSFDLIVCAGTLYHVDAPDLLPFLRSLRRHCTGLLVLDTHVAVEHREELVVDGAVYYGRTFVETHHASDDIEEKKRDRWGSLYNDLSFWPTERSLVNMLIDAGFPFAVKPLVPVMEWQWMDRVFLVAHAETEQLLSAPYPYGTGRMEDPVTRPAHHPMLDTDLQRECTNPATRRLDA